MSTKGTDDKNTKDPKDTPKGSWAAVEEPSHAAAPHAVPVHATAPQDLVASERAPLMEQRPGVPPQPATHGPFDPFHPLTITLSNLPANSKAFITIRDDQNAIWSDGSGTGLVGLSIEATKDAMLFVDSFLVNARELYLQTNAVSQEIQIRLYVNTLQHDLRGRVDLPPNASVTLTSTIDRTSLIGLSSFVVEL